MPKFSGFQQGAHGPPEVHRKILGGPWPLYDKDENKIANAEHSTLVV